MVSLARIRRAWWGIRHELSWGWSHVREGRSSYFLNVLSYRALAVTSRVPGAGKVSSLVTDRGVTIYYRRNRGDVQGIREIFIDEIYRLPVGARPDSLVDLGANIGLATLWFCHEYMITSFVALEPLTENFSLLQRNCQANGLTGSLRQAAVGTSNGTTTFDTGSESNMGRVGEGSLHVELVDVAELASTLPFPGSLLKIDVEGMERELFAEIDPAWVRTFSLVSMEMHPQYFDIGPVISAIEQQGFTYFAPREVSDGIHRTKRERLFVRQPTTLTR